MVSIAPLNNINVSSKPPKKKPTPFKAFLEPVSIATHLNKVPSWPLATSILIELLALILLRSLAIPDSACANIT